MKRFAILLACLFAVLIGLAWFRIPYPADGRYQEDIDHPQSLTKLLFDNFEIAHVYFERSRFIPEHRIPYKDVLQEYPQLGVFYISLPRLLTNSPPVFLRLTVIMNCLVWGAAAICMYQLCKRMQLSWTRILVLLLPSFLYFTVARYDIFPVFLVLLSLVLLQRKYLIWSLLVLTLSCFAKWYPVVFFPFFFAYADYAGFSVRARKWAAIGAFLIGGGIFTVTFFIAGVQTLYPYVVHLSRSLEFGSVYATLMRAVLFTFPSLNTASVAAGSKLLFLLLQFSPLFAGILGYRYIRRHMQTFQALCGWLACAAIVFVVAGKFYSAQWELWWLPLAALAVTRRWQWLLLVAADTLNYFQVPLLYLTVGQNSFLSDCVIMMRTYLLALLGFTLSRIRTVRT